MKNRFEHEINMGRHFLSELEEYLKRDEAVQLEEMTEKYYTLEQYCREEIDTLKEELSEARLLVAKMGMERGEMLKVIDEIKRGL